MSFCDSHITLPLYVTLSPSLVHTYISETVTLLYKGRIDRKQPWLRDVLDSWNIHQLFSTAINYVFSF